MGQGKRGKALENMVIASNQSYDLKGWGLIHKVPTPWNVSYDKRTKRVYRAFPEKKGTVDFIGIAQGRSIAFDAKSTEKPTRFPLDNIEEHQINYLRKHQDQGGISFFIVEFSKLGEVYYLPFDKVYEWWKDSFRGGRKSIPYQWFMLNCDLVKSGRGVALDYLKNCFKEELS